MFLKEEVVEILLVEDNHADLELTIRELQKTNHVANKIIHLIDGCKTLEYLGIHKNMLTPKIILMCSKLPKISSLEMVQKLKENPATSHIPIIIMSSSKDDPELEGCINMGANGYLIKPISFKSLSKAIGKLNVLLYLIDKPNNINSIGNV